MRISGSKFAGMIMVLRMRSFMKPGFCFLDFEPTTGMPEHGVPFVWFIFAFVLPNFSEIFRKFTGALCH